MVWPLIREHWTVLWSAGRLTVFACVTAHPRIKFKDIHISNKKTCPQKTALLSYFSHDFMPGLAQTCCSHHLFITLEGITGSLISQMNRSRLMCNLCLKSIMQSSRLISSHNKALGDINWLAKSKYLTFYPSVCVCVCVCLRVYGIVCLHLLTGTHSFNTVYQSIWPSGMH